MAAGENGVQAAALYNIVVCVSCLFVFNIVRNHKRLRRLYAPKRYSATQKAKPKRLPRSVWGCYWALFVYPEDELIRVSGLDSAIYLRIFKFGLELFLWLSVWCLITVLPANLQGGQVLTLLAQQEAQQIPVNNATANVTIATTGAAKKDFQLTDFDKFSLTNVAYGDRLVWVHIVSIYMVTFITLKLLWRYNRESVMLRIKYLAQAERGGTAHTVLVNDIPGVYYGTILHRVQLVLSDGLLRFLPERWRLRMFENLRYLIEEGVHQSEVEMLLNPGRDPKAKQPARGDGPDAGGRPLVEIAVTCKNASASSTDVSQSPSPTSLRAMVPHLLPSATIRRIQALGNGGLQRRAELDRDQVKSLVTTEFCGTYPTNAVERVAMVADTGSLAGPLRVYDATKLQLEDYLDQCNRWLRQRKEIKRKKVSVLGLQYGQWGVSNYGTKPVMVDAIDFWTARLRELMRTITTEQERCSMRVLPCAFVTFTRRWFQVVSATSLHANNAAMWTVVDAPEPAEIIWRNLGLRLWERLLRSAVMWTLFAGLAIFFFIPVTIVQSLIEVPKLEQVSWLSGFVTQPVVKAVLQGIIPGLVLRVFIAICPVLLEIMARLSGMMSETAVEFSTVSMFFIFQVVAVFLGTVFVSTLQNSATGTLGWLEFIKTPAALARLLGTALPRTATFFITYILVAGVGTRSIFFLRPIELVFLTLFSKMATTARAKARLWSDQFINFGRLTSYHTITILFGLAFSCINPIITPVCVLYFLTMGIMERYSHLFVYKRRFESGGALWQHVFLQVMVSLYVMQLLMIFVVLLKNAVLMPALIPLPALTLAYHVVSMHLLSKPWEVLSLHDAAMFDMKDEEARQDAEVLAGKSAASNSCLLYEHPAMLLGWKDLEPLLAEAASISRRIDGETAAEPVLDGTEEFFSASDDERTPHAAQAVRSSASVSAAVRV